VLLAIGQDVSSKREWILALTATLAISSRLEVTNLGLHPADAALIGNGAVALVDGTRYYEFDVGQFKVGDPIGVPYFEDLRGIAYDSTKDRVYLSGNDSGGDGLGRTAFIDRSKRRAIQSVVALPFATGPVRQAPGGALWAISSSLGTLEAIVINE
jgi:hypothetical protein